MMLIFINLKLLITIEYTSITLYITEYKLLIDKASKNQITRLKLHQSKIEQAYNYQFIF